MSYPAAATSAKVSRSQNRTMRSAEPVASSIFVFCLGKGSARRTAFSPRQISCEPAPSRAAGIRV